MSAEVVIGLIPRKRTIASGFPVSRPGVGRERASNVGSQPRLSGSEESYGIANWLGKGGCFESNNVNMFRGRVTPPKRKQRNDGFHDRS